MKIRNYTRVERRDAFLKENAKGVSIRVAISEEDGAQTLTMSIFELDPDGYTPLHEHSHEHAVFVLRGSGKMIDGKKEHILSKDDVVFVPANQKHQIKNTGDSVLTLINVVPICK